MAPKPNDSRATIVPAITLTLLLALIGGSAWRGSGLGLAALDATELAAATRAAVDGSLLLLHEVDGSHTLSAVSLATGRTSASVALDRRPHRIVPTPGGVSAFVLWPDSNTITVYDTKTLEVQREFALDGVVRADDLSFSPTGEQVYVVDGDGTSVVEFRHLRLELTENRRMQLSGTGPVLTNRRATRLYRTGPEGVHVFFAQTGDLIETYRAALDGGVRFDAGYAALWGMDPEGRPVAIDERSGTVSAPRVSLAVTAASAASAAGPTVAYLAADGGSVSLVDPAAPERGDVLVELPGVFRFVVAAGPGPIWTVSEAGELWTISGSSVRPAGTAALGGVVAAVAAPVDRAGSFACF